MLTFCKHIFVKLYTTYVRCHLEYASPAWSPRNQGDIETLEKVQKRMVSMIPGLQGDSYEEKLRELHLMSLESRRNRTDMVIGYHLQDPDRHRQCRPWYLVRDVRELQQTYEKLIMSTQHSTKTRSNRHKGWLL